MQPRLTRESEDLAIIVPLHNDPAGLPDVIAGAARAIPQPFTVHVAYDSDADAERAGAHALAARHPWIHLAPGDGDPGVVGAVRTAFRTVGRGPTLVTFAGAGDDLSVVPHMLVLYRQGFRIVCASRFAPGGQQIGGSRLKRAVLRATGRSLQWLVDFPTCDLNNNFRLYEAALVVDLGIESTEGAELALELTAKAFRRREPIAEVPVVWTDRRGTGTSVGMTSWLSSYQRWYLYALRSGRQPPRR
jgi:dolichol-phosphate mannosyltransferase